MYFVYILKSSDDSYYTGVTNNLEKRFFEHNEGIDGRCYKFSRRPVECVFTEEYKQPLDAIEREKQIKGLNRNKKEALVSCKYDTLKSLSKRKKRYIIPGSYDKNTVSP